MQSRKQFMAQHGASCRNDRYAWGFVNHIEKTVIFGAWDVHTNEERAMIFSQDWKHNEKGHVQNAYKESMEYIDLVLNNDYQLKTFPMIVDKEFQQESITGRSKIKAFEPELSDMALVVIGNEYYAVGPHNADHAKSDTTSLSNDIEDIYTQGASETERQSLVNARVGQGKFRQNVIDIWKNGEKCALTLVGVRDMLIASHIVSWSACETNEQRLDGANGILLCAHIDKLFDRHKLTFVKQGRYFKTQINKDLDLTTLSSLGIENGIDLCTEQMDQHFLSRFETYMRAHNDIFASINNK